MSLAQAANDQASLHAHVAEFESSLELLRKGDPERPLVLPWDDEVRRRFAEVEQSWLALRAIHATLPGSAKTGAFGANSR